MSGLRSKYVCRVQGDRYLCYTSAFIESVAELKFAQRFITRFGAELIGTRWTQIQGGQFVVETLNQGPERPGYIRYESRT